MSPLCHNRIGMGQYGMAAFTFYPHGIATSSTYWGMSKDGVYFVIGILNGSVGGVYVSSDSGASWSARKVIMNNDATTPSVQDVSCSANGSKMMASGSNNLAAYGGAWGSINYGVTWGRITPSVLNQTDYCGPCALAPDGSRWAYQASNGLQGSSNNGSSWTWGSGSSVLSKSIACSNSGTYEIDTSSSGGNTNYINLSSNTGTSFSQGNGTSGGYWDCCCMIPTGQIQIVGGQPKYLVSTNLGGIWMSKDYGATWANYFNNPVTSVDCSDDGSIIYACLNTAGVYVSTDTGTTWNLFAKTNGAVTVMCDSTGAKVALGTVSGVYRNF